MTANASKKKESERPSIAIFDYGAGNIFSLKAALERNGAGRVSIIREMKNLAKFEGLVLPGVGNFDPAIKSIEPSKKKLVNAINDGFPVLGICLGMEMLFDKSEEGKFDGLKILEGEVVNLPTDKVKVPHMGWNNLEMTRDEGGKERKSRFLDGVKDGSWVYFVHSYHTAPKDEGNVVASSDYGVTIPAVIEKGNLVGVQFHPEKSGDAGAIMIKNFIKMCRRGSGKKRRGERDKR